MINYRADVTAKIVTALRNVDAGVTISNQRVNNPATFPFVAIVNYDDSVDVGGIDSGGIENLAIIGIEIYAYSNKNDLDARQAEIMSFVQAADNVLLELGFARYSSRPTSFRNNTIGGCVTRYNARIDRKFNIYRR